MASDLVKLNNPFTQETDQIGIENAKEVFQDLARALNVGFKVMQDQKFKLTELFDFVPVVTRIPKTVERAKAMLPELQELSDAELGEIEEIFADAFDIENDELEAKIEGALELVIDSYEFVMDYYKVAIQAYGEVQELKNRWSEIFKKS